MWRLGRSLPSGVSVGSGGLGEEAVRAREVSLGLSPGQPFLLRPDGEADVDVLAYFFSSSFGLLSEQTQLSYAKDLRIFLSFLEGQGRAWRSASVADALLYLLEIDMCTNVCLRSSLALSSRRIVSSRASSTQMCLCFFF